MKTVRFKQLVEAAGKPEIKLLWGPPDADKELQRATKEARVLTVHQSNVGTQKDWGSIGFWPDQTSQYLIFPRTLKSYTERRVIGIDYSLFEPELAPASERPKPEKKTEPARRPGKASRATVREAPSKPAETERAPSSAVTRKEILAEVRGVLDELEAGKAIPAFRRLERLAEVLEKEGAGESG